VLGAARCAVPVKTLADGADLAARAVAACGPGADAHLSVELRAGRLLLTVRPPGIALVEQITAALRAAGAVPGPDAGGRSVQALEVAIDALDVAAIRPFWRAVLGYVEVGAADLVDPLDVGPGIWFQRMDAPRPQRNRIHLDVSVPHDEAPRRIEAALAAGGRLVSDARAPMFWVLADPEGNEACVSTWQGRD
jgi:4a-hydroxytetrahydrobiopterin dehydratase